MELNKIKISLIKQISLSTRKFIAAVNNLTAPKSPLFLNTDLIKTKYLSEQDKIAMLKIESYRNMAFEFVRSFQNR